VIKPVGIQRRRSNGWRLPPNTVSVARPGTWGNPHKVEGNISAFDAVALFENDLINLRLTDRRGVPLLPRVHELRGKNLACYCPEGANCHRDVLLSYANGTLKDFPPVIWLLSGDKIATAQPDLDDGVRFVQVPNSGKEEAEYLLAESPDILLRIGAIQSPDYLFIKKEKGTLVVAWKRWKQ
jgi:hypothetical protein